MASSPSLEVQQLLAAEKRATDLVAEARQRKALRLKRAKEEAAAEIEQFKAERQIIFNKYDTEHIGSKDEVAMKIERDTSSKLESMSQYMGASKNLLLAKLIEEVVEGVTPMLHRNMPPSKAALST